MSYLKVAGINHPSATTGGLAISSGGIVTGAGLDYITSSTFSAAATVSVDGCFTATYENYRIMLDLSAATAATYLCLRMRLSGTDSTTGYDGVTLYSTTSGVTAGASNSTADGSGQNLTISYLSTTNGASVTGDLISPALARRTVYAGTGNNLAANFQWRGAWHSVATAYDGLTIYPASGNITGSLTVYGYRKA